ncbi:DNA primase [[Clostridium] colinum]|uniref:DNA primase n=1 Tax=[Clostridium] colinum TaxID=36835 RepID=UPI002024FA3D|nr:DNA primase [[Clostridium] colinum]
MEIIDFMRYSDDIIEDIRFGNDIVEIINSYTPLKQRGNSYVGLCPFHKESTPSFSVSADKQLYHCFGCGASGTVFNFIMDIENYDFIDALKYLADRINYTLPEDNGSFDNKLSEEKQVLYEIHKIVAKKFYENLANPQAKIANDYLDFRGIKQNARIKFGLGYSLFKKNDIYIFLKEKGYNDDIILKSGLVVKNKDNTYFDRFFGRLMFPIIDVQGRVIGFGGRDLTNNKNTAKYLNSPDTPIFNKSYNLYSMNIAKNNKNKELILVEGYIDVISLYQIGITNVVASLGTAFNENHIKLLKKYANKVITLFDSDDAGIKATLRAIPILIQNGIYVKVAQVKDAKDPDEYIAKFGYNNFIKFLNNAKSYISFQIQEKLKEYNLNDPIQKVEFTKQVSTIISSLSSPVERDVFINEASQITSISKEAISQEITLILSSNNNIQKLSSKTPKQVVQNNKLDEARQSILYILATNINLYNKIKKYITPENFLDNLYVKLAKIIFEYNENNKPIYPAELTLKFNLPDEQKKISKVFMLKIDFSNSDKLEKIINDQIKIIKKAYFDKVILEDTNPENIQKALKEKKIFDNLYINI